MAHQTKSAAMCSSVTVPTSPETISTRTVFSWQVNIPNQAAIHSLILDQVFLTLREHLGDEDLDLAGGVLYELIEIDCEHTDDPGAAFQRWRHDHLSRYVRKAQRHTGEKSCCKSD
jgi:hypothetical protein